MTVRKELGFTLIEVITVCLIIAVLAAIAFPSYQNMMIRSRRTDIQAVLTQEQLKLEKHRVDNASYATYVMPDVSNAYYTVTLSGASPTAYTLSAAPKSGTPQTKDTCGTVTLTFNAGTVTRGQTAGTVNTCW